MSHLYGDGAFVLHNGLLQSRGVWMMEDYIATRIAALIDGSDAPQQGELLGPKHPSTYGAHERAVIAEAISVFEEQNHSLNQAQKRAVWIGLTKGFGVISGGAGVGKTSVLRAVYAAVHALGGQVIQMALAGRAARRMEEATEQPARTIAGFLLNVEIAGPPFPLVVIDEASMVDMPTLFQVLRKLPRGCRLLLVGDDMQLPPIRPGLTLHLFCKPQIDVPKVHLTQVYRQEEGTGIPKLSQQIRDGVWPELPTYAGPQEGIQVLPLGRHGDADPDQVIAEIYAALVAEEDGNEDEVRILATTRSKQPMGTVGINENLYNRRLADREALVIDGDFTGFCVGCPIIFTRNDWKRRLTNGSLGTITGVIKVLPNQDGERPRAPYLLRLTDIKKREVCALLEDAGVSYSDAARILGSLIDPDTGSPIRDPVRCELPQMEDPKRFRSRAEKCGLLAVRVVATAVFDQIDVDLTEDDVVGADLAEGGERSVVRAFAMTVHKSQGSQWNRVIVPISKGKLLDRSLIYTAVTRGVKQVVLVGDLDAAREEVEREPEAFNRTCGLEFMLLAVKRGK